MPVIGFLGSASAEPSAGFLAMFRSGLEETGYVEGQNVTIEYRWAENQYDRLPGLAADLVRRRVSVIVASGGPVTPTAAKAATSAAHNVTSARVLRLERSCAIAISFFSASSRLQKGSHWSCPQGGNARACRGAAIPCGPSRA